MLKQMENQQGVQELRIKDKDLKTKLIYKRNIIIGKLTHYGIGIGWILTEGFFSKEELQELLGIWPE